MNIKCPKCNRLLKVKQDLVGGAVKCPCGTTLKAKGPPPAPSIKKQPSISNEDVVQMQQPFGNSLIEELTVRDFETNFNGGSAGMDVSAGKKKMTENELGAASSELKSKKAVHKRESSYKKFTFIALASFLTCLIPVLMFNGYKSYRGSTNFMAAWQKQSSENSLLSGSTGGSKVVGAEAQKPQKINFDEEYREQNLEELRLKFKKRVQNILDEQLALEIERRESLGQSLPTNNTLDWLVQWPETLSVGKLLFTLTDNDYIRCELIITGQPLQFALEGDFFVTGIDGIQWKKSTDSAPFGAKQNTLFRKNLISALVIKMQTPIKKSEL